MHGLFFVFVAFSYIKGKTYVLVYRQTQPKTIQSTPNTQQPQIGIVVTDFTFFFTKGDIFSKQYTIYYFCYPTTHKLS